jgi:predicted amidophosphoribosyltransferase
VAAGRLVCAACQRGLSWIAAPCPRCALPRPCSPCPAASAAFSAAWAPVAFEGPARALVHALKFGGRTAAARPMAAQIAANAPPGVLDAGVLIAVPAHPAHARARGFDQAALLARALARRTGLPALPALTRHAAGRRQVGAGRTARLTRDLGIAARGRMTGTAVLVDDVHTTGATLGACARALREAGAGQVLAVTYARTLR